MVIRQYDICLVNLNPTVGHETKKVRPCVIISPDELNGMLGTVIIAPMTTRSHPYPTRVPVECQGKPGWIMIDQIRVIDKSRLVKRVGSITRNKSQQIKIVVKEMLVD